ncbi:MAG: TetR/AcrR family transcriptional regulator [Sphingomonadales bacterium]|nr:TetR/AcrR family transcriptional regulator [Sphingomonadales bacterium]
MRKLKPQKRGNSSQDRGHRVVASILSAARDVLVEEGYARLTMRNVARRVGITVGNLSYYYANKQDLLHDLLEAVIQGYMEDFDRIIMDPESSPEDQLRAFIRFIMEDLETKETTRFFPALWGLANYDDFAAAEMSKIYIIERDTIAEIIGRMRPDLGKEDCDLLSLFISASMEGHTMFIGYQREKAADAREIINIAVHSLTELVKSIDAPTIRGLAPAAKRTPVEVPVS